MNIVQVNPNSFLYSKEALEGLDRLVTRERSNAKEIRGKGQIRKIFVSRFLKHQ